ncbi:unnamed protein product [Adineta ricciae]|uniref:Uncharacterized protein n=1 Tax=Adineta ricciae TaxID=249248 RepID=A0A815P9I8_ADIRI|nr:unnamed protein product [Adineta ricciae]CAF1484554.1 unnamed protein product [Adineta ricciae]
MVSIYQLAIYIIGLHSVYTLKCYILAPDANGINVQIPVDNSNMANICNSTVPCACGSGKMECASYSTVCTAIGNQKRTTKWIYTVTTKDICAQMTAIAYFERSKLCCYTDLCNNQTNGATSSRILDVIPTLIIFHNLSNII